MRYSADHRGHRVDDHLGRQGDSGVVDVCSEEEIPVGAAEECGVGVRCRGAQGDSASKYALQGVSARGNSNPVGSEVLLSCRVIRFCPERAASFTSIMAAEGSV